MPQRTLGHGQRGGASVRSRTERGVQWRESTEEAERPTGQDIFCVPDDQDCILKQSPCPVEGFLSGTAQAPAAGSFSPCPQAGPWVVILPDRDMGSL